MSNIRDLIWVIFGAFIVLFIALFVATMVFYVVTWFGPLGIAIPAFVVTCILMIKVVPNDKI